MHEIDDIAKSLSLNLAIPVFLLVVAKMGCS